MTRLYLVRHGETVWNESGKFQGHSDIALSAKGKEQAQKLAKALAQEKISAIYASDLMRARETAEIIAAPHGLPVNVVPALREIDFGAWEGLTYAEIKERFPESLMAWIRRPGSQLIPEGESFARLKARAYGATVELVRRHPGETILFVTHGGTIRAIICGALGLELDFAFAFQQDNTAVNIIDFYGERAVLALLNDTSHLRYF